MITKMKKLTFLVYHKEYEGFLNSLRELGVVHIVEKQQGAADNTELQENIRLSNRLAATLKLLQNQKHEKNAVIAAEGGTAARGMQVLDEVDALQTEHGKLSQQLQSYAKEKEALEAWGNFEPDGIQKLKDAGYVIGFYSCSEGNYKEEWETEYNAMIVNRISSKVFFVTVTKAGQEVDLDVEQAKLPAYSLSRLEALYDTTEQAIEENEKKLVALSETDIPSLKAAIKELQSQIEFSKVVLSSEQTAGDKLMLIEGWAPAYSKVEIEAYLNDAHVYYEITDPMPGDDVPIRLNNKGFFAWFEPICKLYMLPKYNELDLTPFFAPFFMIFFGLCLGDSGYGLFLFLGATAYRLLAKKVTPSAKSIISLIQVLAVSTFFCGLLTGTFFGANIYDLDWPIVQRLKHAVLMDNNDMFQLSLILGVIQILFGMVLKAVNQTIQFGFKYAVATIGWIILLVSTAVSFLFSSSEMLPSVLWIGGTAYKVVLCISGAMIFLFNSPGKNIFMNIGLGLWDSYNMVTGLLGDVLSYVRLFALGLSGGILAGVFNSLAVGMSPDNVIAGPIVMVLIFVIGHAINIFMNVLGAMVHPMRLTFVEFFKNSGYEGGGKEYKPFRN
ncbi:V-type ATPase 116kDa subunit family protein [Bacteroides sp. f07]|uniref:V-type ATP synthase subunit I n=1 Tax=Bacteroides sp. f07 TaxID=3132704 RepID=UPI0034C4BDBD